MASVTNLNEKPAVERRTTDREWLRPKTVVLVPVIAVAVSALSLAILVSPEMGLEFVAAIVTLRILLSVARWGYLWTLGRRLRQLRKGERSGPNS